MYTIPQDLRAKTQIFSHIDATTFFVLLAAVLLGYFLSNTLGLVSDRLVIVFNIYNALVFLFLMAHSVWNRGKKNYQSIAYAFLNDKYTYHFRSYPISSSDSCIRTPILDHEVQFAAAQKGIDLAAIRKAEEEKKWAGLRKQPDEETDQ